MRWGRLAACAGLLAACGDAPPSRPPAQVTEDLQVRVVRQRPPALPPLREAPGLAALGAPGQGGDGQLHIHVFNVGHGDSALIVSPTGRTVLVDVGPAETAAFLANRLAEQVQQPVDLLALTSAREEHAGGLDSVLRATSADRLVVPSGDAEGMDRVLPMARARGVPVYAPGSPGGRPFTVELGGGAALELHGPLGPASTAGVVLRVTYGNTAVLLPGDAPLEVETALLRDGAPLRATALKVAAHGLSSSTGAQWLSAVQPSTALLSFGAGNVEGAPAPEVLDRLRAAKVETWRTDLDGELHLQSDGQQLLLEVERPAAGEPVGIRHRYVPGQAPVRLAPTGVPMARVNPVARPPPAPRPAPAGQEELALPGNWGKPAPAAPAAPTAEPAPPPQKSPAPRPQPVEQDGLALPANWAKPPAAPTPKAGTAPTPPAPRAPPPPRGKAPEAQDDLALPSNWGKPGTAAPPTAPTPSTTPQPPRTATPEKPKPPGASGYAASKAAKKFHVAGCDAVGKIKPENLVTFKTREEAAEGREPAKDCNP